MADYDPAHQGAAWNGIGGYEVADGDHQDHVQHSTHEEYSITPALNASGDGSSRHDPANRVGDYDPTSVTSAPVSDTGLQAARGGGNIALKPSPQPVVKKQRTAGGFLVGDSDSEEDSAPVAASGSRAAGLVTKSSGSIQRSSLATPQAATSHASPVSQAHVLMSTSTKAGNGADAGASPSAATTGATSAPQKPPDRISFLETRVRNDPRGALDQWLALISEYRARGNIEESRQVYERFLVIFPQAADIWAAYLEMELAENNFPEAEAIFGKCLIGTPNINLWTKYLDYIRRRNDLSDSSGQARLTVSRAYEFTIDNVGLDKDSGKIWADYIQFVKLGPGTVGGSQWQDQQKMDSLRTAYTKAICVPIANVNTLWKEYDQFEMGLNKITGRKLLADKSPSYMSAKSACTALENITRGLNRTSLPRLPPAPGFDGDQEYMDQVEIWKKWIAWEKSDPLDLKDDKDHPDLYHRRVLYVYNQALMALRFWPEMWVDAAQWCIDENFSPLDKAGKGGKALGLEYLLKGIEANPESVLLALKHADFIESTFPVEENDEAKVARGLAVKEPYSKVLDTLYTMIKNLKDRETAEIARIMESHAQDSSAPNPIEDEDDDDAQRDRRDDSTQLNEQLKATQQGYAAQTHLLSRTISFVWIALIRAMRRIQGKGKPGTPLGGMRQAFIEARQQGRLTSDVYAAVAQLEWTIYKDPAGGKIFDRGARLFPEDENFTLENIKYLHSRDDFTNARVLFETVVNRLTQKPETVHKSKPLYAYFHKYESQFGELSQIAKLEKRMAELFPEDPKLAHFNARYSSDKFDPIAARIIVSPATQLRPKLLMMPSIEQPPSIHNSPRPLQVAARNSPHPQFLPPTNSPKRALAADEFDEPPRKIQRNDAQEFQRGASPLKGAAGRRLDQQRRAQGQGAAAHTVVPTPLARDITFLISQIPSAETFDSQRINPTKMVGLLQAIDVPDYNAWKNKKDDPSLRGGHGRQVSADFGGQYGVSSRESPGPGRPMSPYVGDGARSRLAPAPGSYRQSSLRPGSSGSYEPPPAVFSQQGPPSQAYGNPPPPAQFDQSNWQASYGGPPPSASYGTLPPPVGYGQVPPPTGQYGRYPY